MTVFYRSHDLFSGVKYDFILSSFINQIICMAVNAKTQMNIEPGQLGIYEDSLHVYIKKDEDKVTKFIKEGHIRNNPEKFDIMYKYNNIEELFDDLWYVVKTEEATYYGNFDFALEKINKIKNKAFKDMAKMYYNRNFKHYCNNSTSERCLNKTTLPYETTILRW